MIVINYNIKSFLKSLDFHIYAFVDAMKHQEYITSKVHASTQNDHSEQLYLMADPRGTSDAPGSKSLFIFMQFLGSINFCGWCPFLWEILDPPLNYPH